jgi:protein tyrosine phosphatase (PTP) superfamily phosphohydrolase (DUF442 family)
MKAWLHAVLIATAALAASAARAADAPCRVGAPFDRNGVRPVACAGIGNLYQVTPRLYRSAQLERGQIEALARQLGVRTIVNLRDDSDDWQFGLPPSLGLRFVQAPIPSFNPRTGGGRELRRAVGAVVAGMRRGPVLVHCTHGSDRTGAVVALYRKLHQGWSAERAIAEMTDGPYGFHRIYAGGPLDLVEYVRRAQKTSSRSASWE